MAKNNGYTIGSKSFTAVAINIASKAGEWIKSKSRDFTTLEYKSSSRDLVTEVDKGAETLIRNLIHTYFPSHQILGEEGVGLGHITPTEAIQNVVDAEYVWVIDPIDGTTNFVHSFPFYSVSIALVHYGQVIVGVVYDAARDEMFVAEQGKGAYVGGKRMQVSSDENLAQSLLATGLTTDHHTMQLNVKGINLFAPKVRGLRLAGSAALHLAYVAAGRLSGFWEVGLNAWDVAAGVLLIQEAGGQVTDTLGRPYDLTVRHILATNGLIHEELQAELQSIEATGYE